MLDFKNKFSLHIEEKNDTTLNAGFIDSAAKAKPFKLVLNKDTVSSLQTIPPPWNGGCTDFWTTCPQSNPYGGSCHYCAPSITNCNSHCICMVPPTLQAKKCNYTINPTIALDGTCCF